MSKIAKVIGTSGNYEDKQVLIEINGEHYLCWFGWEKGWELGGGVIEYPEGCSYHDVPQIDFEPYLDEIWQRDEKEKREKEERKLKEKYQQEYGCEIPLEEILLTEQAKTLAKRESIEFRDALIKVEKEQEYKKNPYYYG